MTENILGIKELQLNLKRVADAAVQGASFTVVRDSKPVFRIEPITGTSRTGTVEDFLQEGTFSGDKNLSQRIDDLLYGNTR